MYASKHFLPIFGKKDIDNVSISDIKAYRLMRKLEIKDNPKNSVKRENEISFRSLNIETAVLFHFFNFCIEGGYINKNPYSGIKKTKRTKPVKNLRRRRHREAYCHRYK